MKSIRRIKTRELVKKSRKMQREIKQFPLLLRLLSFLHPVYLYILVMAFCFALSFSDRLFTAIGLTMAFLLVYLYMRTLGLAQAIDIKRIAPKRVTFGREFRLNYEISNSHWSGIPYLVFMDSFGGQRERTQFYSLESGVSANQSLKFKVKRNADFEMGTHYYSGLTAYVQDVFGLFHFAVEFNDRDKTVSFPNLEKLSPLDLQGVEEISRFGNLDVEIFGESPTFSGVRDYRQGDPLKWVSWKLSAKRGELVVREFERLSSADVTICIDMDPKLHMQNFDDSTWEILKKLSLSVAKYVLSSGAQVQIISQESFLSYGGGAGYLEYIANIIMDLKPVEMESSVFSKYRTLIKPRETIVYISPVFLGSMDAKLEELSLLKAQGVNLIGYFMDAFLLADKDILQLNSRQMKELRQLSLERLDSVYHWFNSHQLPAFYFKDRAFRDLDQSPTEALSL